MNRAARGRGLRLAGLLLLAAVGAWAQAPGPASLRLENGAEVQLAGTEEIFRYTRVWFVGNADHVTRIFFVLHGDGIVDYSDATAEDRREVGDALPNGEGALIAYPISCGDRSWPPFTGSQLQRAHAPVLVDMFRQLASAVHSEDAIFEQFALSGAGKVNLALLCLVMEKYDTDENVRRFVDRNLRGIHDGAALCYDAYSMVTAYYEVLAKHPAIRATFIHNTNPGEEVDYGYLYHFKVAELFEPGLTEQRFPKGGSLSLQGGRIRFWSDPLHMNTWKTQFRRVFMSSALP
jgi:hypothetical protein